MSDRAGFSADRLARLDRVLSRDYVDAGQVPNAMIQVWRGNELAHAGMWGFMDIAAGTSIREDAIFRIYSMTKPITGAALLILMEEGLIDLEDDVSRFIPAWKDQQVYETGRSGVFKTRPSERPMRIIDLATHMAGLTYDWAGFNAVDAAYAEANFNRRDLPGGLEAFVDILGKFPLEFPPGQYWNYSLSMDVLAYIVQAVSGMSYGEFLRTRLFVPLGMKDTAHYCPPEKVDRLVSCYEAVDGGLKRDDRRTEIFKTPASLEEGGAGLLSTIGDYSRFCRMLLGGGSLDGVRVLSPHTVALFSTNLLPGGRTLGETFVPGRSTTWRMSGDGFSICCGVTLGRSGKNGLGSPGDFYWSGAPMTQFWVDPKEDIAVVFLTQVLGSPHHFRIPGVLRSLVYGAMTERRS